MTSLASDAEGHGFDPYSGQNKDNYIDICCLSVKRVISYRDNEQRFVDWKSG